MQAQELLKYINHPELLDKDSIPHLQKLVNDFPYFQSGHILLSLAAKKWDASVYQQSIKKTAIVVTNREHLYKLINKPEENENIGQPEAITQKVEETKTDVSKEIKTEEKKVSVNTETPLKDQVPLNVLNTDKVHENVVEKEIEKALVNAVVEKEIIETSEEVFRETKPEPVSFSEWLQFLKKNNGQPYSEIEEKVNREKTKNIEKARDASLSNKLKQKALIDKIIESNPGLIRTKEEQKFFKSDVKAKESLLESEHLVTETLAQIYALQGNINKAIRAYEILSLKFPQKSVYFASLIQKLKNNQ